MMSELHTAHPGINRMKGLARSYVWWSGIDSDLENLVRECTTCQEHQHAPVAAPLHPWEFPDGSWKRIHVDYTGPFKCEMLLVVVGAFSRWFEVAIMKQTTSTATIRKLREIGLPDMLVSDNGTNFTSEEFAEFLRSNGIILVKTAPYHSSSNGLAERAVQTVKAGITKTAGDCIHTKLLRFLLQYRITPQSTTGKSPAELLNQRSVKTKLDLLHPNLQGKVQKQQSQMNMNHDKKADGRTVAVGDTVNVKNFSHGPKWMPGVVVKVTGPVSHEVLLSDERVVRRYVNQIQRRHIDRPKETERQLPPTVPEATLLPDDS